MTTPIIALACAVAVLFALPFWLIWWHRRRHIGPERHEIDNDVPPVKTFVLSDYIKNVNQENDYNG